MRFILVFLLVLWIPISKADQTDDGDAVIPLECYPIEPLLSAMKEEYNEELVFLSGSVNSLGEELYHSLWINPVTQTWSFLVTNKPRDRICLIASGQGFADFMGLGI